MNAVSRLAFFPSETTDADVLERPDVEIRAGKLVWLLEL